MNLPEFRPISAGDSRDFDRPYSVKLMPVVTLPYFKSILKALDTFDSQIISQIHSGYIDVLFRLILTDLAFIFLLYFEQLLSSGAKCLEL